VDFLGELPLDLKIRSTSDDGRPITVSDPTSAHAGVYRAIAAQVWAKVEAGLASGARAMPKITIS
jgi:ATP-binding protein involved in chromosome partitioning